MSLRKTWDSALKQADRALTRAYDAVAESAASGDRAAPKRLVAEILAQYGLDRGPSLGAYLPASRELGMALDKLDRQLVQQARLIDAAQKLTLEGLAENERLSRAMLDFVSEQRSPETWLFYAAGHQHAPSRIDQVFVAPGAEFALKLPAGLAQRWTACRESRRWRADRTLVADTRSAVAKDLERGLFRRFRKEALPSALGIRSLAPLQGAALKQISQAGKELHAASRNWKKLRPDFWTPCLDALRELAQQIKRGSGKAD